MKIKLPSLHKEDACFAGGTLVHTKNGLVPIEQIQVGDWVLSRPEAGGELSYKPVTRTFVHESNDIFLLFFNHAVEKDGIWSDHRSETIIATSGHPFAAVDRYTGKAGWIEAAKLMGGGRSVYMADGNLAACTLVSQVVQTETENLGWAPSEWADWRGWGSTIDFSQGNLVKHCSANCGPKVAWDFEYPDYVSTVYNIEVEDNHTYFVGKLGLWVHNTKAGFVAARGYLDQRLNIG